MKEKEGREREEGRRRGEREKKREESERRSERRRERRGEVSRTHFTGLSPNMAPLYCKAIGTDSGRANSTNTNLKTKGLVNTVLCSINITLWVTWWAGFRLLPCAHILSLHKEGRN